MTSYPPGGPFNSQGPFYGSSGDRSMERSDIILWVVLGNVLSVVIFIVLGIVLGVAQR